jgi:hypothetical protein
MTPEQLRTVAEWAGWNPRYVDGDIIAYDGEKGHEEYAWLGDKGKERITAEGAFDLLRVAIDNGYRFEISSPWAQQDDREWECGIIHSDEDGNSMKIVHDICLKDAIGEAVYKVIGGK